MDTRSLVMPVDIELGEKMTHALRADAKTDLRAAMWWLDEDSQDMRFLACTPLVDSIGPNETYSHLSNVLDAAGFHDFPVSRLWPLEPTNEIMVALRRFVAPGATDTAIKECYLNGVRVAYAYIFFIGKSKAGTRKKRT